MGKNWACPHEKIHTDWSHNMNWRHDSRLGTAVLSRSFNNLRGTACFQVTVPTLLPSTPWRITEPMSPSSKPSFPFFLMCQLFSIKVTMCALQITVGSLSAHRLTTPTGGQMYAWPNYSMGKKYYDDIHKGKKKIQQKAMCEKKKALIRLWLTLK